MTSLISEIASQTVEVGSQSNANFKLAVGGANETVEVTETNADLQTLNATVGTTVNETQIDNLPALQRDVSTFLTLQPGVSPEGSVAGTVVAASRDLKAHAVRCAFIKSKLGMALPAGVSVMPACMM